MVHKATVKKLFVQNIPYDWTGRKLAEVFAPYGQLRGAKVVSNKRLFNAADPVNAGYGFVEFECAADADAAMAGLNGKEVGGRALVIAEARQQVSEFDSRDMRRG